MAQESLIDIVNKVALDLRFPTATTVIGNANKNIQTILSAVKDAAETDVFRAHAWACLSIEFGIKFDGVTEYWRLPNDFDYIINETDWNVRDSIPAGGGMTPMDMQLLRYSQISSPIRNMNWTIVGHNFGSPQPFPTVGYGMRKALLFYPSPQPASGKIDFSCFYISNYYVLDSTTRQPKESLTADSDTFMFDTELVSQGALVKMLKTLGLPFQAAQEIFQELLHDRRGKDRPIRNINMETTRGGGASYPNTPGFVPMVSGRSILR